MLPFLALIPCLELVLYFANRRNLFATSLPPRNETPNKENPRMLKNPFMQFRNYIGDIIRLRRNKDTKYKTHYDLK